MIDFSELAARAWGHIEHLYIAQGRVGQTSPYVDLNLRNELIVLGADDYSHALPFVLVSRG